MEKNLNVALLLDYYGEMLTEKQQRLIDYYYNQDLSLAEIAAQAGISRQGVRDGIKRAECQLLDMEARLGCAARGARNAKALEEIRTLAGGLLALEDPALRAVGAAIQTAADTIDDGMEGG